MNVDIGPPKLNNDMMESMTSGHRFLSNIARIFGSGLIILFFSEFFFVNEGPVLSIISQFSDIPSLALTIVQLAAWYALFALWLLIPIQLFRARSIWALYLCACLCGWAIEGLIIPVLYTDLPFSILWPSLSWHVIVNILFGWLGLRKLLEKNNSLQAAAAALFMGLFWGFWATWFWDGSQTPIDPRYFSLFSFFSTTLLMAGYLLVDRFSETEFAISRSAIILAGGFSFLVWLLSNWAMSPLQFIFPVLVGLVLIPLWKNKQLEERKNIFSTFKGKIKVHNVLFLLLMPLAASLTYPIYYNQNISFSQYWALLWVMILASVVLLVMSIIRIYHPSRPQ
jgi:hypothetical protein